jgi:hypothetical protein
VAGCRSLHFRARGAAPGDGDTSAPRIVFNKVPEPKTVKNRLHLDLVSDTFDAETGRLLSMGARRLRDLQGDKARWTTFAHIEGNEFDGQTTVKRS